MFFNRSKEEVRKSLVGTYVGSEFVKQNFSTYTPRDEVKDNVQGSQAMNFDPVPYNSDIDFAQNFVSKNGKFIYCKTKFDFESKFTQFVKANDLKSILVCEDDVAKILLNISIPNFKIEKNIEQAKVAISSCESLIADEGNIVVNATQNRCRNIDFFDFQIVLASKTNLKHNLEHAVYDFSQKYEIFPFLIDLTANVIGNRFVLNKPVVNSRGTNNIIVFYCEECCF